MEKNCTFFIFISIFLLLNDGIFATRINKLSVPKSVELECDFDLEGNGLYSVKWYKDKREFYRYVPQELPMVKHFPSPGIKLNLEKCSDRIVSLQSIDEQTAGIYMCEVTADAPSFNFAIEEKELKVF